jgi:hypothetical protein
MVQLAANLECAKMHPSRACMSEELTDAEAKILSAELSQLTQLQYEALLKSPYIRMSKKEADAYDARRGRIADIGDMLRLHKQH